MAIQTALMCCDPDSSSRQKRIEITNKALSDAYVELDSLINNVSLEHTKELCNQFLDVFALQKQVRVKFMEAINSGNMEHARHIRLNEFQVAIDNSLEKILEIILFATEQSYDYSLVVSNDVVKDAQKTLAIIIVIVAIMLVIMSLVIITGITKPLKKAVEASEKISHGDFNVDLHSNSKDETGTLMHAMSDMVESLNNVNSGVMTLVTSAVDGKWEYREDTHKHRGNFKEIVKGINQLVDAFVEPIHVMSKFLEDIAIGNQDIQKMTIEAKGDFNIIKNNLNKTHDILFAFLDAISNMAEGARVGNLALRASSKGQKGTWAMMIGMLNDIVIESEKIIKESGNTLKIMATGDLTPRITTNYKGEFEEMKDNINNLGDSLTDLISQLQEAIHTTASASAEISSTADTLAAATQEQSSQTDEVATAMEEMSRTVTNNAHSATQTANVAKQSGEVATSGGKVVEQTISKMKEIAEVVKISANNIAKLGESSKKIGEIISVIDDIADQTNLLSLNAAIEAARAGEQGRGFAVVADSVGKLAVSTASATKEIADMIKGIQLDTDAAVKAMEKGTSEVQSGIELADNAGHSIEDILTGINDLLGMVNQIAAASEQQSATSEEISKNVSSISKVTADSARNVEDVASTANELARMTETLTSLVSQFKINISGGSRYNSSSLDTGIN
jgi:methyl-accepting chemotaxis protein